MKREYLLEFIVVLIFLLCLAIGFIVAFVLLDYTPMVSGAVAGAIGSCMFALIKKASKIGKKVYRW